MKGDSSILYVKWSVAENAAKGENEVDFRPHRPRLKGEKPTHLIFICLLFINRN